ncbi:pseudouridine-5'-phosphatase-like [Dipodomys merriami]|uniref:pseudouridine-5'-phosphatase-like n=1 Tax=Dipodomys merriami TaxID=94247 RepID=UPI003855B1FA
MAAPRAVTHLIFDLDGLLLDTERLYSQVFGELCGRHGRDYSWELQARVMGHTAPEAARVIVDSLRLPLTPQELLEQSQARLQEVFPTARLLPGAERLILHLQKHSIPFALATSSGTESYRAKTSAHRDLFAAFHHVVLGDDPEVKAGKPAPDIFLACARRFSPPAPANQCLVLEDSPHGVAAARAAGMQVVMVPSVQLDLELTAGATLLLPSLDDLRPELFGLPAFD